MWTPLIINFPSVPPAPGDSDPERPPLCIAHNHRRIEQQLLSRDKSRVARRGGRTLPSLSKRLIRMMIVAGPEAGRPNDAHGMRRPFPWMAGADLVLLHGPVAPIEARFLEKIDRTAVFHSSGMTIFTRRLARPWRPAARAAKDRQGRRLARIDSRPRRRVPRRCPGSRQGRRRVSSISRYCMGGSANLYARFLGKSTAWSVFHSSVKSIFTRR